jgi:hypothetical protein
MTIRATAIVLLFTLGLVDTYAQGKPAIDPWFNRSPRAGDFYVAKLPWSSFSIELPDDWHLVPGFGSILLTVAERRSNQTAGAIVIEHTLNVLPRGPSDVDERLAKNEVDFAQGRDPAGTNFLAAAKEVNGQRFMLIQYSRPGFGATDRVAVYVFPAGKVMYRLICVAPETQLSRYQAIFAHVASSFKPVIEGAK